mmetsp:Transcript_1850/g.2664  ORF Transcript_1850/g.2664 Transcript_1850/m.2664 type:complete len:158 (-) Transcript_1850:127-600(-)
MCWNFDGVRWRMCMKRLILMFVWDVWLNTKSFTKITTKYPKKYPSDPELGAWVTMIRRIGRDNIPSNQRIKLDEINFAWKSTRKCGSSFMTHYRVIKEKLNVDLEEGEGVRMDLLKEEDKKWITAQRIVYEKGNLSEARVKYMDQLVGLNWREPLED